MARKKIPASDLKLKLYSESLPRGKIYILEKKEKANLVILIEKTQKTRSWLVKRKKKHRSDCEPTMQKVVSSE